jgi:hypothetical protein
LKLSIGVDRPLPIKRCVAVNDRVNDHDHVNDHHRGNASSISGVRCGS